MTGTPFDRATSSIPVTIVTHGPMPARSAFGLGARLGRELARTPVRRGNVRALSGGTRR